MKRVALLASALVLAACSTTSAGGSGGATGTSSAPSEIVVATGFAIENLDPLENGFWAPEFGYSDLLMKPVRGGTVEPWVLQKLTATSDTVWQLDLRPKVKFQDGNPLDAANLAALLTYHIGREETGKAFFDGATAKKTGPLTVELTTRRPVPNTPSLLANEGVFPLFDLAAYRKTAKDELVDARIYVGPYTVTSLDGQKMSLTPTTDYYGGPPPLTSLTVNFVPDADARIKAVQAGEASLALYPPTAASRQLRSNPSATYLVAPKGTGNGGPQVFLNLRNPALADVRVRKAIQLGTDYTQLADQVMNGLYDTSQGLYPAGLPFSVSSLRTDATTAASLLDQAGWKQGGGGVRSKDGEPLSLTLLTYPQQPDVGTIAVGWQAQLKALGIELRIRSLDDIDSAMQEKSGWDLGITMNSALGMTGTDPVNLLVNYYSNDGEDNYDGISDAALDSLIQRVRSLPVDSAERVELLKKAQQIIVTDQAYSWFLAYKRTPVVATPSLANYPVPVANLWLTPYS